jgi:DNA-binding protein Fis
MQTFITKSQTIQDIIKGLELSKNLFVSSIIIGAPHTGKKSLLRKIFKDTTIISAKDKIQLESTLESCDEIIITDFELLDNISKYDLGDKKIIATANYVHNQELIDDTFAFIYHIPPLIERQDDVKLLASHYLECAKEDLGLDSDINTNKIDLDLSNNTKSLKQSIYKYMMIESMSIDDIKSAIYEYLYQNLDGKDGYKEHLHIYEEPLINAGLSRYKSQLKLSSILGINRNTLRKKILEHKIDA